MYLSHKHFLLFLLLILLPSFTACGGGESDLTRRTRFIMGTLVEITVREADKDKARDAITSAFQEMSRLEGLMSTHRPDSDVSKLNREAGGEFIAVSLETLEVLQRSLHWAERSAGALDISIGPATQLWNFDEETKQVPDPDKLKNASDLIGYRDIQIEDGKVRLARPGMALNLGAIGKGYAVDRAVEVLKRSNIQHALVNAGGDLMVIGSRDNKQSWRVGLQHPRSPEKMIASMALADRAVATSGDYQRYFIRDGIRYHHILNPSDGMPARGMISSTIIADKVMDADALATAVFVLGPDKGMALIESLDGVEGMIVTGPESVRFSGGFRSGSDFVFEGIKNKTAQ